MQDQTVPHTAADDERGDSVPQRSMDDTHTDDMEYDQPVATAAAQGDHTRR